MIDNSPILRSFGIINLRVDPNPSTLTLNGGPYINGEKKFVDYGKFEIYVAEPGYIPFTLDIELSQNHSFYLNNIRLFKNSVETLFDRNIKSIEKLGNGYLMFDSSGSIWSYPGSTLSGAIVQVKAVTGSGGITATGGTIISL